MLPRRRREPLQFSITRGAQGQEEGRERGDILKLRVANSSFNVIVKLVCGGLGDDGGGEAQLGGWMGCRYRLVRVEMD